ncbi:BTB/POZ domain-containing protein At1g01640-like [Papaver somniferum]|uniref:BTB/POZ domain-containing protein At1g01640-like n=1 Tax=Papaver somniferum TaxID=3469 RepID=UPI000E6FDBF5|nr:BTB/POZ domain-containing protein At1g01640-like [Papaver somniferum]
METAMQCSVCDKIRTSGHCMSDICAICLAAVKDMLTLIHRDKIDSTKVNPSDIHWGITAAQKWVEEVHEKQEGLIGFLGGFAIAFKEATHTDILVEPCNGPAIPAHRALLATRSEVFKNMLAADTCKAAPADSISLREFNHEELEAFVEFPYCGNLGKEKFEKHFYSLTVAADKYAIPYLQKFCEREILKLIDSSNALKVLEVSDVCSNQTLKIAALEYIIKHTEELVLSPTFDEFAAKNPHLMANCNRACFILLKEKKLENKYLQVLKKHDLL